MRTVGTGLLALGAALLLVAALGHFTPLGNYPSVTPPSDWEDRFDPALPPLTRDFDALYRAAETASPRPFAEMKPDEVMQVLFYKVADRFTHGDRTVYTLWNNWAMALAGVFYQEYRYIHAADAMLRFGHSAICDQVSYILYRMADRAGIRARQVALTGHIVFEAFYDGDWHLYDPDFEVIPRTEEGEVLSVEALSKDPALVRWAYHDRLAEDPPEVLGGLVEYYTTPENNTPWDYPPVWWQREEKYQNLKFWIPLGMIALGGALLGLARPRAARTPSPASPAAAAALGGEG